MEFYSPTHGFKQGMGSRIVKLVVLTIAVVLGTAYLPIAALTTSERADSKLKVEISVSKGL